MKGIRLECPLVRKNKGTCLLPPSYQAKTYIWLQRNVDFGTWLLGVKPDIVEPEGSIWFDAFFSQLEVFAKIGWVTEVKWYSTRLVMFREESGHFHRQLQLMVAQSAGWFLYKPAATWKD